MSKLPGFLFVVTMGACAVGLDYYLQAKNEGVAITEFGSQAYVLSVRNRYNEWRGVDDTPLVSFLPEPTGNWTRKPWSRDLEELLDKPQMPVRSVGEPNAEQAPREPDAIDRLSGMFSRGRSETLVYIRPPEVIHISIRRTDLNALEGAVASRIKQQQDQEYFARLRGVNFIEAEPMFRSEGMVATADGDGAETADISRDETRTISGSVFGKAVIQVKARAKSQSIRQVLSEIDYDGLTRQLQSENNEVGNKVVNSLPQIKKTNEKRTTIRRERVVAKAPEDNGASFLDKLRAFFGV